MNIHEISTDSYDNFIMSNPKTVICYFSPQCINCKLIEYYFHHFSIKYPDVIFAKYNIDKNKELMKKYQITILPTIFIYKKGIILYRYIGTTEATLEKLILDSF